MFIVKKDSWSMTALEEALAKLNRASYGYITKSQHPIADDREFVADELRYLLFIHKVIQDISDVVQRALWAATEYQLPGLVVLTNRASKQGWAYFYIDPNQSTRIKGVKWQKNFVPTSKMPTPEQIFMQRYCAKDYLEASDFSSSRVVDVAVLDHKEALTRTNRLRKKGAKFTWHRVLNVDDNYQIDPNGRVLCHLDKMVRENYETLRAASLSWCDEAAKLCEGLDKFDNATKHNFQFPMLMEGEANFCLSILANLEDIRKRIEPYFRQLQNKIMSECPFQWYTKLHHEWNKIARWEYCPGIRAITCAPVSYTINLDKANEDEINQRMAQGMNVSYPSIRLRGVVSAPSNWKAREVVTENKDWVRTAGFLGAMQLKRALAPSIQRIHKLEVLDRNELKHMKKLLQNYHT